MGFVNHFRWILQGSLWEADAEVRLVWLGILDAADGDGVLRLPPQQLAADLNVNFSKVREALRMFEAPDDTAEDQAFKGRRLEAFCGGYLILGHEAYLKERRQKVSRNLYQKDLMRARRARSEAPVSTPPPVVPVEAPEVILPVPVAEPEPRPVQPAENRYDLADLLIEEDEPVTVKKKSRRKAAQKDTPEPADLARLWNAHCGSLRKIKNPNAMDAARKRVAACRLTEEPDLERWKRVIVAMSKSRFCLGLSSFDRSWVANFDFLTRPGMLDKAEEGQYECKVEGSAAEEPGPPRANMPLIVRYLVGDTLWQKWVCDSTLPGQQQTWDATFPPRPVACHKAVSEAFRVAKQVIDSGGEIDPKVVAWFHSYRQARTNAIASDAVDGLTALGVDLSEEGIRIERELDLSSLGLVDETGTPL